MEIARLANEAIWQKARDENAAAAKASSKAPGATPAAPAVIQEPALTAMEVDIMRASEDQLENEAFQRHLD